LSKQIPPGLLPNLFQQIDMLTMNRLPINVLNHHLLWQILFKLAEDV
jgi:hypothetical protein